MSNKKPRQTAPLSIRIDKQLKADVEALAASDDRSVAKFVQKVLRQYVDGAQKKPRS